MAAAGPPFVARTFDAPRDRRRVRADPRRRRAAPRAALTCAPSGDQRTAQRTGRGVVGLGVKSGAGRRRAYPRVLLGRPKRRSASRRAADSAAVPKRRPAHALGAPERLVAGRVEAERLRLLAAPQPVDHVVERERQVRVDRVVGEVPAAVLRHHREHALPGLAVGGVHHSAEDPAIRRRAEDRRAEDRVEVPVGVRVVAPDQLARAPRRAVPEVRLEAALPVAVAERARARGDGELPRDEVVVRHRVGREVRLVPERERAQAVVLGELEDLAPHAHE
jgi:hypothetical protein